MSKAPLIKLPSHCTEVHKLLGKAEIDCMSGRVQTMGCNQCRLASNATAEEVRKWEVGYTSCLHYASFAHRRIAVIGFCMSQQNANGATVQLFPLKCGHFHAYAHLSSRPRRRSRQPLGETLSSEGHRCKVAEYKCRLCVTTSKSRAHESI
jgi:hypothetical protein